MRSLYLFLIVWCQLTMSLACGQYSQPWQPGWSDIEREDLRCYTSTCDTLGKPLDTCCPCHSCMSWEGSGKNIDIEYISVVGKSVAVFAGEFNQSEVYRIQHSYSDLKEIPSNVCDWDKESNTNFFSDIYQIMREFWEYVVELDFTGNKIRRIPDINCLKRLDKLDLSYNNIIHVSNSSFYNLSRLRNINLERNQIKHLDINVFSAPQLNMFHVDVSNNIMETLDVSNMLSLKPFCSIEYTNNKITNLVSENFVLDMNKPPSSGFVSMNGNQIKQFPNFKELLNLTSWEQMGQILDFGFDFKDIPLVCDCNIQPFLEKAESVIETLWRDYMNVKCTSPPEYAGIPVVQMKHDQLICNVSLEDGCPTPDCSCVDKPSENTLYINCANGNLKEMPNISNSAHSKYISLNVSGNNIQTIKNKTYLPLLASFDISHNDLREINNDVIDILQDSCTMLNISDNPKMTELPRKIQYRKTCSTHMNNLLVHCGCDTLWIETWLKQNVCSTDYVFQCNIPGVGVKLAADFHESDLQCKEESIVIVASMIASGIILMIIIGFTVHSFKYELLILYLRSRRRKRNTVMSNFAYDVFISYNENEDHVREWVAKFLNPHLMKSGYTTFIALRDINFGAERDSEVISAIQNSQRFLIVLSESYLCGAYEGMRSWTENEWKYGWYNFRSCPYKKIVLVNFDHIKPSDVDHPVIKAYLRVGYTVDFKNQDRTIMDDIEKKLGGPAVLPDIDARVIENKKTKFSCDELFMARPFQLSPDLDVVDFENDLKYNDINDDYVNFTYT
ncbi:hypothetical protein ACF0H5_013561 [Mactra antiquata]